MWPLVCNEVALSYDQEERLRNFQRTLLQTPMTWLDRHTARSSGLAMQSLHDGFQAVAVHVRQRERNMLEVLNAKQKLVFLAFCEKNADKIKARMKDKENESPPVAKQPEKYEISKSHHFAANLYILNHRLQKVMESMPTQDGPNVSPAALRRLARRPSFESLGQQREESERKLTRDASFASSGSLMRSSSSMLKEEEDDDSMDEEDKPHPQQVSPEDGQEAAIATVERALGFIRDIIPASPQPVAVAQHYQPQRQHYQQPQLQEPSLPSYSSAVVSMQIPDPDPVSVSVAPPSTYHHHQYAAAPTTPLAPEPPITMSHPMSSGSHPYPGAPAPLPSLHHYAAQPPQQHQQHAYYQQQQQQNSPPQQHHHHYYIAPHPQQPPPPPLQQQQLQQLQPTVGHVRGNSFLPPHLNVVPEDGFLAGEGAEDFFISLMDDEDWAIGEGVDMDVTLV
jgi:hypothetical protein